MNRNLHSRGQHLDSFPLMVHYSSSSSLNLTFPFTSTSVWENTIICHVVGTTSVLPVLFEYLLSDNGIIFYILYILYIPAAWWTAFCWTWRGWVRRYLYNISKYIYIYIHIYNQKSWCIDTCLRENISWRMRTSFRAHFIHVQSKNSI